ncbi:MAG: Cof-type HAD-IIB family hydrolase [Acidobacteriaceae bacterium]
MQKRVRMIAVDIDGTLLNSHGVVSQRNKAALKAAEAAGVEVVVATGRRHSYAMPVLKPIELHTSSAVISSNGTITRTVATELLDRTHLPTEAALRLCTHLQEYRNTLVLTFDRVGLDGDDRRGALVVEHLEELNGSISRWMQANEKYIEHVRPIERALETEAPIQVMLCGTVARMQMAEELLRNLQETHATPEIEVHRTEYAQRDLSIVDILPAGCSKGRALLRLAAERGVDAAEIMAIGDNWNDLSMLETAGQAVVMANASPELQKMAADKGWAMTATNDEDGVAHAVEQALLAW